MDMSFWIYIVVILSAALTAWRVSVAMQTKSHVTVGGAVFCAFMTLTVIAQFHVNLMTQHSFVWVGR